MNYFEDSFVNELEKIAGKYLNIKRTSENARRLRSELAKAIKARRRPQRGFRVDTYTGRRGQETLEDLYSQWAQTGSRRAYEAFRKF